MVSLSLQSALSLVLALVLGGVIGLERELHKRPAGLRTHALISLASSLFTMLSLSPVFGAAADPSRIASQILTGMGFVGAGVIISSQGEVKGVTTAVSLWVSAAVGMAAGLGEYGLALLSTALSLIILWALFKIEEPLSESMEK